MLDSPCLPMRPTAVMPFSRSARAVRFASLSRAELLDRRADLELAAGHHALAEALSNAAEALREGAR